MIKFKYRTLTILSWHELIYFDLPKGEAYWKERDLKWFADSYKHSAEENMNWWNNLYANKRVGCVNKHDGYLQLTFYGQQIKLHRLIWFVHTGKWPKGQIDHINGIRTDNRIENLREVTCSENAKNQRIPKNNTSGHIGVDWQKRIQKWRAQIKILGDVKFLGYFASFEDAVAARKAAEIKYGFHPNHGAR